MILARKGDTIIMKKSELKATLGSLRAGDGIVEKTMLAIRQHRQEERREPFFLRMGYGVRLAGAACALLMVIGIAGIIIRSPEPPADSGIVQKANENADTAEAQNTSYTTSSQDSFDLLSAEAQKCTGEWAIIKGSVIYASIAGDAPEGTYALDVRISLTEKDKLSSESIQLSDSVEANALFSDEAERQKLIDSIDEPLSLLIEKDGNGSWKIKKIVY